MTEEELKLKAEQSAPGYMNTVERAIYISAYTDGFEECREENKNKFDRAKELLKKIYNFEEGIETEFPKFDLVKWSIETRDFLKDSEVGK